MESSGTQDTAPKLLSFVSASSQAELDAVIRRPRDPIYLPEPRVPPLTSSAACPQPERRAVADRLQRAYRAMQAESSGADAHRDLWTLIAQGELKELAECLESGSIDSIVSFLDQFGASRKWFGGLSTSVDAFSEFDDERLIAEGYFRALVQLGVALGLVQNRSPDRDYPAIELSIDGEELVRRIESFFGAPISPPLGVIHTDGIQLGEAVLHYRHINALYLANRIRELVPTDAHVAEIGGGLGLTALYLRRTGLRHYSMFDLPLSCTIAGYYLANALGGDAVAFYGEPRTADQIAVLPTWEFHSRPAGTFALTVNCDSFPEMAEAHILGYLDSIKRCTSGLMLSINHESFYPRTVNMLTRQSGGFHRVFRSPYWIRRGFVEELFSF